MASFGPAYGGNYYGYGLTNSNVWLTSATTYTEPIYVQPSSDWQRAEVKAEPDDEFSWLRKSVREIEELAFA